MSRKINKVQLTKEQIEQLTYQQKCDLLNSDPVTLARYFQHRLENYFRIVLKSNLNVLGGNITKFAIKIEFQMRGSPHAHMLLWVQPHMTLCAENIPEFVQYLDNIIAANIPGDSETSELVKKYQRHRHSRTCRKKNTFCRFNFPRFNSERTIISSPIADATPDEEKKRILETRNKILSRVMKVLVLLDDDQTQQLSINDVLKLASVATEEYYWALSVSADVFFAVHLKRNVDSIYINNFNKILLKCFEANIDISPVIDAYACVFYLVSYFAKEETASSEAMKAALAQLRSADATYRQTMQKLAVSFLNSREISVQEAVYRSLPMLWLRRVSPKVVFINTNIPDERIRKLRPKKELEMLSPDSDDIFLRNDQLKYADRPNTSFQQSRFAAVDNLCFAEFMSYFTRTNRESPNDCKYAEDYQPDQLIEENQTSRVEQSTLPDHFFLMTMKDKYVKRRTPAVIRFHNFKLLQDPEKYYHHLLILYFPWRSESDLLGASATYASKFNEPNVESKVRVNRMKFEQSNNEFENALHLVNQNNNFFDDKLYSRKLMAADQEDEEFAQFFDERINADDMSVQEANDEAFETSAENPNGLIATTEIFKNKNTLEMQAVVRSLNKEQRMIFDHLFRWLRSEKQGLGKPGPLLIVHGAGGTGKSYLIETIAYFALKALSCSGFDFTHNVGRRLSHR